MLYVHVLEGTSTSLAGHFTLCVTYFGYCKYLLARKVTYSSLQDIFRQCCIPPLITIHQCYMTPVQQVHISVRNAVRVSHYSGIMMFLTNWD
jgi:hypothetical protein